MASSAGVAYVDILPALSGFGSILRRELTNPINVASQSLSATLGKNITAGVNASFTKTQLLGTAAFAAVGVAAVAGMGKAVGAFQSAADETRRLSVQLGISAEEASKLRVVAQSLGIDTDQLSIGFGMFEKKLVDGGAAFEKYGISLTNADGTQKSFNQLLGEAADKYKELGGGVAGTAFAIDVFGRSGKNLIPLLAQGSAGIARQAQLAEKLGLVMGEDDVKAARELGIAQRQLGEAFQGLEVSVARALVPLVKTAADFGTVAASGLRVIPGPIKTAGLAFLGIAGAIKVAMLAGTVFKAAYLTIAGAVRGAGVLMGSSSGEVVAGMEAQTLATTEAAGAMRLYIANASGVVVAEREVAAGAGAAGTGLAANATAAAGALSLLAGVIALSGDAVVGLTQKYHGLTDEQEKAFEQWVTGAKDFKVFDSALGSLKLGQYNEVAKKATAATKVYNDEVAKGVPKSKALADALAAVGLATSKLPAAEKTAADATAALADPQKEAAIEPARASAAAVAGVIKGFADPTLHRFLQATGQDFFAFRDKAESVASDVATAEANLSNATDETRDEMAQALADANKNEQDFLHESGGAYKQWHDDVAGQFSDLTGVFGDLARKEHLSAADVKKALDAQVASITSYATTWKELISEGAPKALLAQFQQMGPGALGVMQAVAGGSADMRKGIFEAFKTIQDSSDSLATRMEKTIVGSIHDLIDAIREALGLPPLDWKAGADTRPATAALNSLIKAYQHRTIDLYVHTFYSSSGASTQQARLGGVAGSAQGGFTIPGYGGGDKVRMLLEPGEGIVRKEVVRALGGPPAIAALNSQAFTEAVGRALRLGAPVAEAGGFALPPGWYGPLGASAHDRIAAEQTARAAFEGGPVPFMGRPVKRPEETAETFARAAERAFTRALAKVGPVGDRQAKGDWNVTIVESSSPAKTLAELRYERTVRGW